MNSLCDNCDEAVSQNPELLIALNTVLKVLNNALNPSDVKYRILHKSNASFRNRIRRFEIATSCLIAGGFIEYETTYKWSAATPEDKEKQWEKLVHTTEMLKAVIKRHPNKPEDKRIDVAIHMLATVVDPQNLKPFIMSVQDFMPGKPNPPELLSYMSRQVLDMAGFLMSCCPTIQHEYFTVSIKLCNVAGACIEAGGDADSGADLMIRILNTILPLLYAFDTSNEDAKNLQVTMFEMFTPPAIVFISGSVYAQKKVQQDTKLRNLVRRNREKSVLLNKLIQIKDNALITVVHYASKNIWDVSLCGCSDNLQFLGLLTCHFINGDIIEGDGDKVSKRFKSVWDGSGPRRVEDNWICPWAMVNWTGLINDSIDNSDFHYISGEATPDDILTLNGRQILILAPPGKRSKEKVYRNFRTLKASVTIKKIYTSNESNLLWKFISLQTQDARKKAIQAGVDAHKIKANIPV